MRRLAAAAALFLIASLGACTTPAAPTTGQKVVVYFQEWSANLDDPAKAAIANAAQIAKANPAQPVTVTGFAAADDNSRQANLSLSQTRAQVVVDQLKQDGVDGSRIKTAAKGPTEYALSAVEARRVEISIP